VKLHQNNTHDYQDYATQTVSYSTKYTTLLIYGHQHIRHFSPVLTDDSVIGTIFRTEYISLLKLESTHRVQTSAKEYVLVRNVKLVHDIKIRLFTKIVGMIVLTPSA